MAVLWGYTVDDALVTGRLAHQLATGHGYRFNPGGPVVDAVTPLGWAYWLVPFAGKSALGALHAARWIGAVGWAMAATWLGARMGGRWRFRSIGVVATALLLQAPLAAWAVSGMETGVITALATLAVVESRWAILAAGWAAAWRPELVPWAVTLMVGSRLAATRQPGPALGALVAVLLPSVAVVATRLLVFGSPAPLAATAKPSDLAHGGYYVLAALVHTGVPLLIAAPLTWRKLSGHQAAILAAFGAHLASLVLVGGDWMAFFRLMVPVFPGLLWVAAAIADRAPLWATLVRWLLCMTVSARLLIAEGPKARQVVDERARVIDDLAPALSGAHRVAALDVGWVGVATPVTIVDLAGITDPDVALLPGGHTSKRLPPEFLRVRHVDRLVVLVRPRPSLNDLPRPTDAQRWVEVLALRQAEEIGVELLAQAPLGSTGRYLVLSLKSDP